MKTLDDTKAFLTRGGFTVETGSRTCASAFSMSEDFRRADARNFESKYNVQWKNNDIQDILWMVGGPPSTSRQTSHYSAGLGSTLYGPAGNAAATKKVEAVSKTTYTPGG